MTAPIVWPQTRKPIEPAKLARLGYLGRSKRREEVAGGAPVPIIRGQLWERLAERAEAHS